MALRENSNREHFATTIKKENKDKIKLIAEKTGLNISKITDLAIEELYTKITNEGINLKF